MAKVPTGHTSEGYDYDGPDERPTQKRVKMTPEKPQDDPAGDAPPAWRHKGGSSGKKGGY